MMSKSNVPPAERLTISSRSPLSNQDSQPKEPVFDENEETESFYVILDISGDDFAAYGKYRDGRKFRPRMGDRYYEDDASGSENAGGASDSEGDEPTRRATREDENTDPEADNDDDDEDDGGNDSDGSGSTDLPNVPDGPRESSLQILDLDSQNPLVSYEGKIYTCRWKISNGTEMIFEPPPPTIDPSNADEDGRKLRQNQESRLFATTIHRLEGWPGKLKPKGRDKQEVSTKARMFAERLDAVLEHRLKEAAKNEEDVSGVTMKKFSEGQQAPAGWRG